MSMTDPQVAAERERFEKWAIVQRFDIKRMERFCGDEPLGDLYNDRIVRLLWETWQAAFEAGRISGDAQLRSALERVLHNFELILAHKPVRDASETIAEAMAALKGEAMKEAERQSGGPHGSL